MITINQANRIYKTSADATFKIHRVSHSKFREFSFKLQNLIRNLGDDIEIEDWQKFTRRLKRYRFEQLAAPLGFGNQAAMNEEDLTKLNESLRRLRIVAPMFAAQGEELLELLKQLVEDNENPLFEKLCDICDERAKLSVVILETRLMKPTKDVFTKALHSLESEVESLCNLNIVGETQLRGGDCFDEIVCLGASRWYGDFVFDAPRAKTIHLLQFDWLRESGRERSAGFIKPLENKNTRQQNFAREMIATANNETLESKDVIPNVNLAQIAEKYAKRALNQAENEIGDTTESRLFWLEGRRGVFLEENSRVLVIDFEAAKLVRKIAVAEIAQGMFVLLRDGRGGDLIVPIANKIMGKQSAKLRQFQSDWKRHLLGFVKRYGGDKIVEKLKLNGAVHANEVNLRNWLSPNNIETRDPLDFAAMMKLCGYETALEDCQKAAKIIRRAHQKAGARVRRLLLEQVAETDLTELIKLGEMRFEITKSGGNLVAVRVVNCAAVSVEIETKQLNRRFALD